MRPLVLIILQCSLLSCCLFTVRWLEMGPSKLRTVGRMALLCVGCSPVLAAVFPQCSLRFLAMPSVFALCSSLCSLCPSFVSFILPTQTVRTGGFFKTNEKGYTCLEERLSISGFLLLGSSASCPCTTHICADSSVGPTLRGLRVPSVCASAWRSA